MTAKIHNKTRLRYVILLLLPLLMWSMAAQAQRLTEYLPAVKADIAVVVCPGGSYCWLSKKYEGSEVGKWLADNGIAAYVLEYPTAGWAAFAFHTRWFYRGHQHPDALNALSDAIRGIRQRYRVVGAMGFSAGGHLVLSAAAYLPEELKPDFIVPVYPVVTFSHPSVHRRSRRGLLGEHRWHDKVMCDSLSMERHADRIDCPVLLINCKDDPVVNYRNSELMDSALTANNKPHRYIQYATGGHGFGTTPERTTAEAILWKKEFLEWFQQIVPKGQKAQ